MAKNENYNPTIYVLVEDEGSRKYYRDNGIKVVTIPINGSKKLFALIPAVDQEEADRMNRILSNMIRRELRADAKNRLFNVSYDQMLEDGYDAAQDYSNPEEIYAEKVLLDALFREMNSLVEEKSAYLKNIAAGISERKAANEIGIPQKTYNNRKKRILSDMKEKMENY